MAEYYYWFDTTYIFGDYNEPKWALWRGELTEDGKKDRKTETVVIWDYVPDTDDLDELWEITDRKIEEELGFLPDYEVN